MTAFKMTARHHAAAETLAITGNIDDAAASAGVSARTLRRWREQPAFQDAVNTARWQAFSQTRLEATAASVKAVRTLTKLLDDDQPGTVRARAARTLLDFALDIDADDTRNQLEDVVKRQCDLEAENRNLRDLLKSDGDKTN